MRSTALAFGLVLVLGLIGAAEDGSVAWPTEERGVGDVAPEAMDVVLCAILCGAGGCDIPGTQLDCTCSGGRVCCLYYRCLQSPWWKFWEPCYCGTEIECTGIPCTPGQPIPESAPRVQPAWPM
jgi:hypothetical protein